MSFLEQTWAAAHTWECLWERWMYRPAQSSCDSGWRKSLHLICLMHWGSSTDLEQVWQHKMCRLTDWNQSKSLELSCHWHLWLIYIWYSMASTGLKRIRWLQSYQHFQMQVFTSTCDSLPSRFLNLMCNWQQHRLVECAAATHVGKCCNDLSFGFALPSRVHLKTLIWHETHAHCSVSL